MDSFIAFFFVLGKYIIVSICFSFRFSCQCHLMCLW